ncbi:inositol monophosphatase family protein [Paludibaculum fermentans]|uniref:Histidinol-phosphatase n=1 Tax=Paludibaculum fermentans TaxID=1473598 RepID=A0A7S7SPB8_PALFE|nr:inositol monophosphatase family protein [Paludibaculum fermentans]QOY91748.1 histidinol-phosphatase [Paludibaculum fermentans]
MGFERELAVARQLASEAGSLALRFQSDGFEVEDKPDDSPVTAADKACEKLFASTLESEFPADGLLGEEGANKTGTSGRRWIIDPIDGTRDFVRGNRLWSNLLGLEVDGVIEVGVATFPALDEQYYAVRGGGAFRSAKGEVTRLKASSIDTVERAVACVLQFNNVAIRPHSDRLLPFMSRFWAVRSLGGAWDSMFVASGHAEFWLEPSAKPWDLAAISVICKEAGCRYYDYKGNDTIYGGNAVVVTPALEPEVRTFLGLSGQTVA